jgi:hypothetical protein
MLNRLAMLSVLYEDLRIETSAISEDSHDLDKLAEDFSKRYRIHYFLRRSIATLWEFRRALLDVSKEKEYRKAREQASGERLKVFKLVDSAQAHLEENMSIIKKLRNDVGGHFDESAAEYATSHLSADPTEKLEIFAAPFLSGGAVKLHYAGEIAAVAFTKNFPGVKPSNAELDDVIKIITDGHGHAVLAVQALILLFLWDRFDSTSEERT